MNGNQSIKELQGRRQAAPDRGTADFRREVMKRLKRTETRLVSGLDALGANPVNHADGITVNHEKELITITSLGTTVADLLQAVGDSKAEYYVVYNGVGKCVFSTL